MKMLFLCSTEFQLLTALNIRYHMHPDDDADIIVNNYHGEEKELADRIRKTGLFHHVFSVRSYREEKTLHRYFRCIIDDDEPGISFLDAVVNSLKFIKTKLMTALFGAKQYINNMVDDSSQLRMEEYEALFAYGSKKIACHVLDYILKHNLNCRINLIDEGTAAYCVPELGRFSMPSVMEIIDTCYLYDPEVVIYKVKLCKVPSLKKDDREFIAVLNYIFQFDSCDIEDYRNAAIFFDQNVFQKMPKYLQKKSRLLQLIFHNSHKRHLKEEREFFKQIDVMNFVLNITKSANSWVKLHPRSSKDIVEELHKKNIRIIRRYDLPWELIALNCPVGNNLLITNDSSSVCLYNAALEYVGATTQCELLCCLVGIGVLQIEDKTYFDKLCSQYNNFHIPESIEDLIVVQ